jgi:tRNA-splicing ligase RtcB
MTSYDHEIKYIKQEDNFRYTINQGFVPGMRTTAKFYVNSELKPLLFDELAHYCRAPAFSGGFLPAVKQLANVATLPRIVGQSIGMPDIHSGLEKFCVIIFYFLSFLVEKRYGFAIGNVAAFDMSSRDSVVSPGGVGFDINCLFNFCGFLLFLLRCLLKRWCKINSN